MGFAWWRVRTWVASPAPTGRPTSVIWSGSPGHRVKEFGSAIGDGVGLCDYTALAAAGSHLRAGGVVLLYDPPADPDQRRTAASLGVPGDRSRRPGALVFAERASADRHEPTAHLRALYRTLRENGENHGWCICTPRWTGDPELPHSPETAAVLLRVLIEVGAAQSEGSGDARRAGVVSSEKVELGFVAGVSGPGADPQGADRISETVEQIAAAEHGQSGEELTRGRCPCSTTFWP